MAEFPGVILAGGRAQRMGGGDKCLLPLAGQNLLDHVLARLVPQCTGVALNANGSADRFRGYRLPILPDETADQPGPLAGVLAAMDWAKAQGADHVVTVAADTPFFPRDLVTQLTGAKGFALAASQATDEEQPRLHPIFGLWPVALAEELRTALAQGERKVRMWALDHGAQQVVFRYGGIDPFFNINTREDLRQAKAIARSSARADQCFRMK
ncbi:MAG: molybdenum cofactor guanylyltransferase MobA [Thalassovita sp.]